MLKNMSSIICSNTKTIATTVFPMVTKEMWYEIAGQSLRVGVMIIGTADIALGLRKLYLLVKEEGKDSLIVKKQIKKLCKDGGIVTIAALFPQFMFLVVKDPFKYLP